jgi:tetratricopeptide (TPR) repeat protein
MVWLVERLEIVQHPGPLLRPRAAAMTDDVRAALSTLLDADPHRAAWLSAIMMWTWIWSGRATEGLRWNELAMAADPEPSLERCWSLFAQAGLLAEVGRKDEAMAWFAKAEALMELTEHAPLKIQLRLLMAMLHDRLGDHQSAMRVRQAAIRASRRDGDEWALARALNHTAMSLLFLDRAGEAIDLAKRSIELCRRVDPMRLPYVMDTLAQAHAFRGDFDSARQSWFEALALGRDEGWGWSRGTPAFLFGLALVAGQRGKKLTALRLHYCAEEIAAHHEQVRTSIEAKGSYGEPLAPREAELVARLEAELGPETAATLRAEGQALTPEMAITLAVSEG